MGMFDKLAQVVHRFDELNNKLADPAIYDRLTELKEVSSERANLAPLVDAYKEHKEVLANIEEAKNILKNESDPEMREFAKEELAEAEKQCVLLEQEIRVMLLPKDPLDDRNVMVEIRAGVGGDEASIFVHDVYRMYQNYFKELGFKSELDSVSKSDTGFKEIIFTVSGDKVYSKLKYESGVHRVQRVPDTEAQGRIHTSTITVAVIPEADPVEFELEAKDVRIDVYRAGGPGGQCVNTTDSAVRMTHIPTGVVVAIQDEKSQLKNRDKAWKILRNRIFEKKVEEQRAKEAAIRKGQVGRGDRSERIRTYNFPQGRLTDHRIGLTLYNLDKIIEGNLSEVIDALVAYHQAELLQGQEG